MPNRVQRRRTKPSQAQRLRAELTRCELRRPSVRAGLRDLGLDGDDLELLDAIVAAPMDNAGLHHKYRRALAKVIRRSERQITRRLTRMVELGVLTRIAPPKVATTEAGVETWESLDCNGYRIRLASLDNPSRPNKHRRDTAGAPPLFNRGTGTVPAPKTSSEAVEDGPPLRDQAAIAAIRAEFGVARRKSRP